MCSISLCTHLNGCHSAHIIHGCLHGAPCNSKAYVSIRQHTSAYVSIRQHTSANAPRHRRQESFERREQAALVFAILYQQLRQYLYFCTEGRTASREESLSSTTSIAYVSIRQHTSAYVSTEGRTASREESLSSTTSIAYVSIRQHTSSPKADT